MAPLHLLSTVLLLPTLTSAGVLRDGIIGGHDAKPHSRPYMAYLMFHGEAAMSYCGGFLVREDFVMTAAHCQARQLHVLLGAHDLTQNEPTQELVDVKESFPHPDYSSDNLAHDIMLLKLNRNATLNRYVQPIPVKSRGDVAAGTACSTAGWGDVTDDDTYPDKLQEVETTALSRRECGKRWMRHIRIDKTMTCATDQGSVKGFCSGDSGGPLVCGGASVGVVSFSGAKCGDPAFPDVYTRIASYRNWIEKVMSRK